MNEEALTCGCSPQLPCEVCAPWLYEEPVKEVLNPPMSHQWE